MKQLLKRLTASLPWVLIAMSAPFGIASASEVLDKTAMIDTLMAVFEKRYVYPDVAKKMDTYVRTKLEQDQYDEFTTLDGFTGQLTDDLRQVSEDKHIAVYKLEPDSYLKAKSDTLSDAFIARHARNNFGFVRVERLRGNVGYLKFNQFDYPEIAAPTAIGAMGFLANCDAIIIDLRDNGGGKEAMVQLLLSYFFRDPTLLINVYDRDNEIIKQTWTLAYVPGERMPDTDLYVLTSGRTASGAEAFAYDLKCYERATIVGETTKGMAHWVEILDFPEYGIRAHVPYARPASPKTQTSWEKVGVEPDIETPAAGALEAAHLEIMKRLLENCADEEVCRALEWDMPAVVAQVSPVAWTREAQSAYTGVYGDGRYSILIKSGQLYWRFSAEEDYVLLPLNADLLAFDDTDDVRFRIIRDDAGDVSAFQLVYRDGDTGNVWQRTGSLPSR